MLPALAIALTLATNSFFHSEILKARHEKFPCRLVPYLYEATPREKITHPIVREQPHYVPAHQKGVEDLARQKEVHR